MDAREILYQLNEKGYKSITADQLKEFMRGNFHFIFFNLTFFLINFFTDLKKLIKYDTTTNHKELSSIDKNVKLHNYFNSLHETTTVSSRAKKSVTPPEIPPSNSKVKDVAVRDDNNKENIKPTEVKNKTKENSKKTEMEPKTTKMCK